MKHNPPRRVMRPLSVRAAHGIASLVQAVAAGAAGPALADMIFATASLVQSIAHSANLPVDKVLAAVVALIPHQPHRCTRCDHLPSDHHEGAHCSVACCSCPAFVQRAEPADPDATAKRRPYAPPRVVADADRCEHEKNGVRCILPAGHPDRCEPPGALTTVGRPPCTCGHAAAEHSPVWNGCRAEGCRCGRYDEDRRE